MKRIGFEKGEEEGKDHGKIFNIFLLNEYLGCLEIQKNGIRSFCFNEIMNINLEDLKEIVRISDKLI